MYDKVWPTDYNTQIAIVKLRYQAGYASAADVPETIKLAIKMAAGYLYFNRTKIDSMPTFGVDAFPLGFKNLLWPYREDLF